MLDGGERHLGSSAAGAAEGEKKGRKSGGDGHVKR